MQTNTSSGRVEIIDILRGFALFSILLVHFSGEFAGWSSVYISPVSSSGLPAASADSAVNFLLNLFLINKARALFAFLFGVGFYYQLAKASRNGYRIESRFATRMLMLFIIGVLHAYLVWAGDILRFYAICGMALLLVYRQKPRTLFILAAICTVLVPAVSVSLRLYFPFSFLTDEMKVQMYNGFAGEQYADYFRANLLRDIATNWDPYAVGFYFFPVFGNFLLGYLAARVNLFDKLGTNRQLLHRCLLASFVAGFLCSSSFVRLLAKLFHTTPDNIPAGWRAALSLPGAFGSEVMAFFLLCLVVWLYRIPFFKRGLSVFAFAGRMTLTNYIMQSTFGVLFFYGIGLGRISRYGAAAAFAIGLVCFIVQLWYSRLWLRYFSTGPVEYVWRSLAEGKWQPMRRKRVKAALL